MKTLNELVDRSAANGTQIALITQNEKITYSELNAMILETAAGFTKKGVREGDCVAIIHRNSPYFITAYLGLNRLGAIAVPINFMVSKPDELAYMLNDCRAVGVVTQKEFLKGVRAALAKTPGLKTVWVSDAQESECQAPEETYASLRKESARPPAYTAREEDTVAILYTSGTTGSPKGVMLTNHNLYTNCESAIKRMGLRKKDICLNILPMFHSFGWTANVLVTLFLGAKLVISSNIAPAKPWLKMMGKYGVTLFSAVPQVYAVLAKEAVGLKGFVLRWWFFRKVRFAISGSAPLSPTTQTAFETAFGIKILEGYGLTETSPAATLNSLDKRRRGSVGLPIDGVQIKIVDDQEKEVPVGAEGEVCIRGENIMRGYFNLPDATREAFTADGWFKSGDIGILDKEGYLYIRDRKKDMIIVKGLKVFSAQVEAALQEHPEIEEAAIIGIPDETGDEMIKAFIKLRPGAAADKAALMHFCREKFDPYKRPRTIEIVETLPKNALQKVLKRVLRQQELDKRNGVKA